MTGVPPDSDPKLDSDPTAATDPTLDSDVQLDQLDSGGQLDQLDSGGQLDQLDSDRGDVVFEQDQPRILGTHGGIIAVHKPAWMLVHPAGDPQRADLCSWLDAQADLPPGLRPVHRLDAQASGVVLCAADPAVRAEVSGWLARGEIDKSYVALVHGRTHRKGIIRRPLVDARRGRPLPALTRYRRLEWLGAFTFLEVRPASGRKHQIRRHLHGLGHPLVGDDRYRPRRFRPVPGFPGRLWLHAIGIMLPDETIFSAPLPPELEAHLDLLGA